MAGLIRNISVLIACGGLLGVPAGRAHAQDQPPSPSAADQIEKLRAENEELKRRLAALERELSSAKATINAMKARASEPTKPAPTKADIPDDPLACPDAMLADLKRKYESEFGSLQDPRDDASLRLKAQRWTREVEREARGKATWVVKVARTDQIGQGANAIARATATVLDATTRLPMGDNFAMDIPPRFAGKMLAAGGDTMWQIALTVAPRVKFNPQRHSAGKPDVPPFVGRYVELEPEYIIESVTELKK